MSDAAYAARARARARRSERAQVHLRQLVTALQARGLLVAAKLPALTVKAPAVLGQDPHGQQVLIRYYKGRGLTWCWVWPGQPSGERGAPLPPPEVEPMCPAKDIERAARLITQVVRLRDDGASVGGSGDV